jgi:GNAT superfamily N-acetyltransferase
MDVIVVDPADTAVAKELFALHQAVHATDWPDLPEPLWEPFLAELREPSPEVRIDRLAARIDGRLVGDALLALPEIDNRHLAICALNVLPTHRRRGIGRALLAEVCQRARAEQRRSLLCGASKAVPGGPPRPDAGPRFLEAMGFAPALAAKQRRIDLTAVDPAAEQDLLAECLPHATGYECVSWTGPTPDRFAGEVARLVNRLNTDAPTGDVEVTASTMDATRLRAEERVALDRGTHLVAVAARHRDTGELAAITRVDVRPIGDHGTIWVTIADPRHRGHRLGTIVKIELHRLLRRDFPGLRHLYTGNADENAQMVAINDRLGYLAYDAGALYQLALEPPAAP